MAGPTRAAGQPDHSSDSSSKFTPQIWSGKLIEKLYKATIFGEIANTDYEGEIKSKGDSVVIRTVPSMVVRDYEIGGGLQYDTPTSDSVELQIDRAKYFAFKINNIDKHQSDLSLMDSWSTDGGEQMKIAIDGTILSEAYADADAMNAGATAGVESGDINLGATGAPVEITKDNVLDIVVDMGTVLDEQNVPETGRWLVLPAWLAGMLKKSDLRDASAMGDSTSAVRNGRLGMLDRFTVYTSNNLSRTLDNTKNVTNVMFGHKKALTFASQMTEMDTLKNPNDFGSLIRGLNVFGFEVIDPKAMGHLYAVKG
ncbi:hypothetical protein [Marinomonas atlantica]|uniref:hypothetical protein n=1 Tax=Marinomonas atlantica TaxID=1806668 RepID=UPI00082E5794|nr:hypothetical protein [Marinomonas atlantica]